jgi:hypothetical protein
MMTDNSLKAYLYKDSDYECSLSKFVGKKVVDLVGYPSAPFGGDPVFKINKVVFDDGSTIWTEGEHDVAYIPATDKLKNMDEETLQRFIDEDSDEETGEDEDSDD